MHRIAAFILFVFLASCASRPGSEVLVPIGTTVSDAKVVSVYAVTTREMDASAQFPSFNAARAEQPSYLSYQISVPPTHVPGQIEWPRDRVDPRTTFATLEQSRLSGPDFLDDIAGNGSGRTNVSVFIHGYNLNFAQSLYRITQLSVDAGTPDTPILFAWPSAGNIAGYVADQDSATFSRDALARLLSQLARDRRIGRITVLAHSMGSWLTAEVLRQLRLSGDDDVLRRLEVILAAPDIDVDVFRRQTEVIGPLDPPMTLLVASDDRALMAASRLRGARQRVGELDVTDPQVQAAAREGNIVIIDISSVGTVDGLNHSRFVSLAADFSRFESAGPEDGVGSVRRAGAFVFDTVGRTVASPFTIIGEALATE